MTNRERAAEAPLAPGKLPPALLGHLLSSYITPEASIIVGPGIGRDAAVIEMGDRILVATTDPITFAAIAAAHLVNVNANDLACLGATPRWLLATALFREGATAAEIETEFSSLARAAPARIALVGGHTEIVAGLDRTILSADDRRRRART